MGAINDLITSDQIQSVIDAVTNKTKAIFVPKATYNAKISELESTIAELTARIEVLEGYHTTPEEPINGDDSVDDDL